MAAAATPNLGLPQWTAIEDLSGHIMSDFNAAFLAIDGLASTLVGGTSVYGALAGGYIKTNRLVIIMIGITNSSPIDISTYFIDGMPEPLLHLTELHGVNNSSGAAVGGIYLIGTSIITWGGLSAGTYIFTGSYISAA